MSKQTRSKSKNQEMSSDSGADSSAKLADILTKMDVLIRAKDQMLCKLNKVEETQRKHFSKGGGRIKTGRVLQRQTLKFRSRRLREGTLILGGGGGWGLRGEGHQ